MPITIHWIVPVIATVIFGAAIVGLFLGIMVSCLQLIPPARAMALTHISRTLSTHTSSIRLLLSRATLSCDQSLVSCFLSSLSECTFNPTVPVLRHTLTGSRYDALGVHWAGSLVGFIALVFVPAPM